MQQLVIYFCYNYFDCICNNILVVEPNEQYVFCELYVKVFLKCFIWKDMHISWKTTHKLDIPHQCLLPLPGCTILLHFIWVWVRGPRWGVCLWQDWLFTTDVTQVETVKLTDMWDTSWNCKIDRYVHVSIIKSWPWWCVAPATAAS